MANKYPASSSLTFTGFLGLAPAGSARTNLQFGETYHLADATSIDPLSTIGVLTPGKAPSTNIDGSSNVSAKISKFVGLSPSNISWVGAVERGAKVHLGLGDGTRWDTSGSGLPAGFPASITGTGTHAAHTTFLCDDIIYHKPSGKFLVSYTDNTDGDVATVDVSGTVVANYFSTLTGGGVLDNSKPHPMELGENGYVYVADGGAIHKLDVAGATVTTSAIDLSSNWTIYDMIPYKGFMWVLALQSNVGNFVPYEGAEVINTVRQAGVFLWNYQSRKSSEFTGFEKGTPFILDNVSRVAAIFIYEGVPHVFTLGSNLRTQLRRFTGSSFQVVWEEPGDILPVREGVTSYFNNILWAAKTTGALYTFGRMSRNLPETFNKIGSTGAATGAIFLSDSGAIWASYGTSSLKIMDGMATDSSITTVTKQLPGLSRINRIKVHFQAASDTTANNTITVTAFKNFGTSAITSSMVATHAGDLARGWVSFVCGGEAWNNFSTISLKLQWANSAGMTTSFKPYRIEVEYTSTGKDL